MSSTRKQQVAWHQMREAIDQGKEVYAKFYWSQQLVRIRQVIQGDWGDKYLLCSQGTVSIEKLDRWEVGT